MDPAAPLTIRYVYARWKATEVVEWPLWWLKRHPVLQRLDFISVNLRPLDLSPESLVFQEVTKRLWILPAGDRMLLLSSVCITIKGDQEHPHDIGASLFAWQELGFRCAYGDGISELALNVLGKRQQSKDDANNFHTTRALKPLLTQFWLVKVDIDYAGMLFLSHPCLGPQRKKEVLQMVRREGLVYVAHGPSALRNTEVQHTKFLKEFAEWAIPVILRGKLILIELTVRRDDENCAVAIQGLKELGVDVFGDHAAHFCFQGGLTGQKAFDPEQLAAHVAMSPCEHAAQSLQSKLYECQRQLITARAASIALASARVSAEIQDYCASVAGAATEAAKAATSVAVAANGITKALPDQDPTVTYRISLTKELCKRYKMTPAKLFSDDSAIGKELDKPCVVIAEGSYPAEKRPAELDSEMEAVIIVKNSDPPVSKSDVKVAVKRLVKRMIEKGSIGAGGTYLGNPRVWKVSNPPEQPHATEGLQFGAPHSQHNSDVDEGVGLDEHGGVWPEWHLC